jgi:HemY protein
MKRFLIFLLVLLVSVWIGIEIAIDPGYVLITRNKLAIEMPLWLTVIGLLTSFIVIYFLIRVIRCFCALPKRWSLWLRKKQQRKQAYIKNQALFTTIYQEPKDWNAILKILPELEKIHSLSPIQIRKLEKDSYEALLKKAICTNLVKFEKQWQYLPRYLKKKPYFINFYIQALIQYHETDKAESLTRKLLRRHWLTPLVQTYGLIKSTRLDRQLKQAENWLKKYPKDPTLLLCLGRLCKQLRLWGKARDYLETSLMYDTANPEVYQELGELFEITENPTQALQYFKKAILNLN